MIENESKLVDDKDDLLQYLVRLVNNNDETINITLTVGGVVISGEMIGGYKYLQKFGDDLTSKWPDNPETEKFKMNIIDNFGSAYAKEDGPPPDYIHILNARIFDPSGKAIPSGESTIWRGKINSVDGFRLGSL
jgi:hypothetical protein